MNLITYFGLTQIVNSRTCGGAILDQIFVDPLLCTKYNEIAMCPSLGLSDHLAVFLKGFVSNSCTSQIKKVTDFRKSHMGSFIDRLTKAPWHLVYENDELTLNDKCNLVYTFINSTINVFPYVYVKMSCDKAWITPLVKHLINLRDRAFRERNMVLYSHYKFKVKDEIVKAKSNWISKSQSGKTTIWTIVREICDLRPKSVVQFEAMTKGYIDPSHAAESFAMSLATFSRMVRIRRWRMFSVPRIQMNGTLTYHL